MILKLGYLSDYNFKSLDFDFIWFLFSSAFRGYKFIEFWVHLALQFNI